MEHEVLLRLEDGFWKMYVDMVRVPGYALVVSDEKHAFREARDKAKELSPCELTIIGYHGIIETEEKY